MNSLHLTEPVFKLLSSVAEEQKARAFVIGGYVRDMLLGIPCKDIDIVVEGSGIHFAEAVAKKIGKNAHINVFKSFGTAMLRYHDLEIEFVGARKESYRSESRKPIVEDGTLKDDQLRRDFTMNALAVELKEGNEVIIDPFNGIEDLKNGQIRTPLEPGRTFSDDPLRMLRAIRFSSRLGFTIVPEALNALEENAHRISIVSQERITEELNKIILSKVPSVGFKLLFHSGLLKHFFPELLALHGVDYRDGKGHKDNYFHTLQVLDNISRNTDDLWLRWSALLHDIAKPETKRFDPEHGWTFHGHEDKGARLVPHLFKRLKLPLNDKMKYVQKLVLLHLRPIVLSKEIVTDSAVRRLLFEAGDDIDDLMMLCEADITSKNPERVKKYLKNFELVRTKLKEIEEKDKVRNWQPPVSGIDIMETFNLQPCREVGVIKTAIREAILEGEIHNNFNEAYQFMLRKGEELGLKAIKILSSSILIPDPNT